MKKSCLFIVTSLFLTTVTHAATFDQPAGDSLSCSFTHTLPASEVDVVRAKAIRASFTKVMNTDKAGFVQIAQYLGLSENVGTDCAIEYVKQQMKMVTETNDAQLNSELVTRAEAAFGRYLMSR